MGWWRRRHPGLLLSRHRRLVVDHGWDEPLFDTSTAAKRRALAAVVGRWTAGCAKAGYRAVQPDNLDSWQRSRGALTEADNLAFARLLIARAHRLGLAIAQKNAAEIAARGRRLGFDFAIAEECQAYAECRSYTAPAVAPRARRSSGAGVTADGFILSYRLKGTLRSRRRDGRPPEMSTEERDLEQLRPQSFAIAYRMLGSVSEAEDVVQEALLRIHQAIEGGEQIASPQAYVATVTTRLAINELRSARARRERYVGEWLPEPILTDSACDPVQRAEMADSLSVAMLVLLESLSAEQRAALLLHDVFDYGYAEIAEIIGKSEDNVRQLATRARRHVQERRPRFQSSREQREELAQRFLAAARQGDLAGLEALLAHDAVLTSDGGGKVPALARSLRGRSRVARTLLTWMRVASQLPGFTLRPAEINGGSGMLALDGRQRLISVWSLEIAANEIRSVRAVVNPDKLAHLGVVGDFASLVAGHRPSPDATVNPQPPMHTPGGTR